MSKVCYFNTSWLSHPNYRDWLEKLSAHKARCKICEKIIDITNMGESALKSHAKGAKHVRLIQKSSADTSSQITDFFGSTSTSASSAAPGAEREQPRTERPNVVLQPESRQSTLQDFATKDEVLKSEILWALHVIETHQSYRSCRGINALFHKMFPDSSIASQFQCSEKETAYLNVFGIAPHFRKLMKQKVDSKYVLLFDESLNKKNQMKQMDFYIRMWHNDEVRSRYLDSKFVGHCTANDMLLELNEVLQDINQRNLVQLSMDGPSVNWKFHRSFQTEMETNYGRSLLDVGSCGLHILHGAFQTGVEKSDIGVATFLRALYTLFRDSPARREDYLRVTGNAKLPLKFCKTRWLDNSPCALRAIDIWDSLCKFVTEARKESISNPSNQSYTTVKQFVNSSLSLARLKFFLAVSQEITPFLTTYQTDEPLLPFITLDLHKLMIGLLERFIKHSVTEKLTPMKLSTFDVRDNTNYVDISQIDLGLSADKAVKEVLRAKKVSDRAVLEFRYECRKLLIELMFKLIEKSPIKYPLARSLACLDPTHFNEKEVAVKYMRRAVSILTDAKWITPENGDETIRQYSRYLNDASNDHRHFNRKEERLDKLWYADIANKAEFSQLWAVVSQLLLLSHGQATVERGFSINKEIEVENLRQESIIAQRTICDHLHFVGGVNNVEVDKKLLLSASAARRKYQDYLEDMKRKKLEAPVLQRKRKLEEELSDFKAQQKVLKTDIDSMQKTANEFFLRAEKERDLTFVSKANSLRESCKRKENELIALEKKVEENLIHLRNL